MAEKVQALSIEDMQRRLLATQLETAEIQREEVLEANRLYRQNKEARQRQGKARLANIEQERKARAQQVANCRHRAGGSPDNMAKGNGMSTINRFLLPDGVTVRLSCTRCPLKLRTPNPDEERYQGIEGKKLYKDDLKAFNVLNEQADQKPFSERPMQGPTFSFKRNGVPFVPVMC